MIKTAQQIQTIKDSGKYLNELLHLIYDKSKPGIALIELEFVAEDFLKKR
jgi:methionine aminopeptidase